MGFFSANCEGCEHPLLSTYVTNEVNVWMNRGVAITRGGSILKGSYDGYGRLEEHSNGAVLEGAVNDTTVWHEACWLRAGAPQEYRGASAPADDQGFFFEDGAHDLEEPSRIG